MKNNHPWVSPLTVPIRVRPFVAVENAQAADGSSATAFSEAERTALGIPSQGLCDSQRPPHA